MATPALSFAACFPAPVPIPEMGLALGPATLCHLAALDLLRCPLLDGDFGPAAVATAAHVLASPSAAVQAALESADGAQALRRDAAAFAAQLPAAAAPILRAAVIRCVNEAFATAVRPANPTAGDQPAPLLAGPLK